MKKVIVNFSRAVLMVMAMPMNALAQFEKPSEVSNAEAVLSRNIGTTWKVLLWIALSAIVLGLVIAVMYTSWSLPDDSMGNVIRIILLFVALGFLLYLRGVVADFVLGGGFIG